MGLSVEQFDTNLERLPVEGLTWVAGPPATEAWVVVAEEERLLVEGLAWVAEEERLPVEGLMPNKPRVRTNVVNTEYYNS